ncbi:MAG: hypothetical protein Q9182_005446 [Xanthomendoza sp. 2 TL-2023]
MVQVGYGSNYRKIFMNEQDWEVSQSVILDESTSRQDTASASQSYRLVRLLICSAVELNLRLPSMLHGKKGFERIVWAFKNVLDSAVTWVFHNCEARQDGSSTNLGEEILSPSGVLAAGVTRAVGLPHQGPLPNTILSRGDANQIGSSLPMSFFRSPLAPIPHPGPLRKWNFNLSRLTNG